MNSTTLKAALIAVFAGFFMMGCEDNHAEDAGERIDEAVTDVQNSVEDACENVKDAANADDKDC